MIGRRWQNLVALVSLASFAVSPPLALCASATGSTARPVSLRSILTPSVKVHEPVCRCCACKSKAARSAEASADSANNDSQHPSESSPLGPESGFPCGPTGCCWCNAAKAPCCPPPCDLAVLDAEPLSYLRAETPDTYHSPIASLLTRPPRI